jgi:hypothetical protein
MKKNKFSKDFQPLPLRENLIKATEKEVYMKLVIIESMKSTEAARLHKRNARLYLN